MAGGEGLADLLVPMCLQVSGTQQRAPFSREGQSTWDVTGRRGRETWACCDSLPLCTKGLTSIVPLFASVPGLGTFC